MDVPRQFIAHVNFPALRVVLRIITETQEDGIDRQTENACEDGSNVVRDERCADNGKGERIGLFVVKALANAAVDYERGKRKT